MGRRLKTRFNYRPNPAADTGDMKVNSVRKSRNAVKFVFLRRPGSLCVKPRVFGKVAFVADNLKRRGRKAGVE